MTRFPPGQKLGSYIVRGPLGEGGLAAVYRAFDVRDGREVALKVLTFERRAETPGLLDRLDREAAVLGALEHVPAVVKAIERFEDPETRAHVLALEFVEGRTLATRLGDPTLTARQVVEWMGHACHALHDVHAAGWVHRDIKPENLILGGDPDVPLRLIDFNSAGSNAAAAGKLTRVQGVFPHTPAYLAPECFDGVPPDTSADVYALAMTFAELLVGRHPLLPAGKGDLDTTTAWQRAHEDVPFPDLTALRGDVPASLQRVLERATAKSREDRIPDAVALWAELKEVWDGWDAAPAVPPVEAGGRGPVVGPAAGPPPGGARSGRTALLAAAGLFALGGLGGAAGLAWDADRRARASAAEESVRMLYEAQRVSEEARAVAAGIAAARTAEEAERRRVEEEAARRERDRAAAAERARAIGTGVEPIGLAVIDRVTLDKLRNARRIGSHWLTDESGRNMGTAAVEELGGVTFFEAFQSTSDGGSLSVRGVVTEADERGVTVRGTWEVRYPGDGRCGWQGDHRFNLSGHPWYFRMQGTCPDRHHYVDLFVDDAWLDAHPEHKPDW